MPGGLRDYQRTCTGGHIEATMSPSSSLANRRKRRSPGPFGRQVHPTSAGLNLRYDRLPGNRLFLYLRREPKAALISGGMSLAVVANPSGRIFVHTRL